mgnify:CR=1 FL=1
MEYKALCKQLLIFRLYYKSVRDYVYYSKKRINPITTIIPGTVFGNKLEKSITRPKGLRFRVINTTHRPIKLANVAEIVANMTLLNKAMPPLPDNTLTKFCKVKLLR